MVEKTFCDYCGLDITKGYQRELCMLERLKQGDDFMEVSTDQLCKHCSESVDEGLEALKANLKEKYALVKRDQIGP
jgi:hypothetical protein